MFARHKLETRGYIVLYRAAPEEMINYLRTVSHDQETFWIHETWDGSVRDENRVQAFVPNTPARQMSSYFQRYYRSFYPGTSAVEWHFLKTAGGAQDQLARREFLPVPPGPASLDVSALPGSIYVATQDGTYFYGYGWNKHVPLQSDQQLIELNKGDIVLFRGDYIFARAGCEANNLCVHAFIDTPSFLRPEYQHPEILTVLDDKRRVDDVFCFVWKCPFVSDTKNSLLKHLNRYHGFRFNQPREIGP